jgi:acetyl-CoA acyltransferase
MSASDEIWILGIKMTKFGKHLDQDTIDLAADATLGALDDAGVSMSDIGVIAAGNLMNANASVGQQLQKQIGQTGIPVYNVANACATGATALRTAIMAVKAGEVDYGMAVGVEKLAGAGLLAGGSRKADSPTWTPSGRYGAVAPVDGRIGTETMPGVFAQIGMEYDHKYGGASFELFAKISEKNHAHSTLNPLAAYQKKFTLEQIMSDVMIAYPNTRPMCSANCDGAAAAVVCNGETLKSLSLEQQRRHPHPQRCQDGLREGRHRPRRSRPRRATRLLRHRRAGALRQPDAVRRGWRRRVFQVRGDVAGRLDPGECVRWSAVQRSSDRGDGHCQRVGGLPPPAR